MRTPGVPIEELLCHADFVRRLARELVGEGAGAEDLAQEVWLAALHQPPRSGERLRGWLSVTARNLLANRRREQGRRGAREQDAAREESVPSAELVLEREEVRAQVVRAVLALDEPLREVVLLRYYEGLAPREVARRLGVPAATVRTRLHRGLLRLRARLDEQHGGRRSWAVLLAPWTRFPVESAWIVGGIVMKKLLVSMALLGLGLVTWRMVAGEGDVEPQRASPVAPLVVERPSVPIVEPRVSEGTRERTPLAEVEGQAWAPRRVFPTERGLGVVWVEVVDADGRPLTEVAVRGAPHLGHLPPGLVIDDDRRTVVEGRSDAEGRFRLEGLEEGPVRVEARFEEGGRAARVVVLARGAEEGPIRLAPPHPDAPRESLSVRVVDGVGAAVAGAEVEVFGWSRRNVAPETIRSADTVPLAKGRTDAEGRFSAEIPGLESGVVLATGSEGLCGLSRFQGPRGEAHALVVTLARPTGLVGELLGARAEELVGATLSLHALVHLDAYSTAAGRRFEVELSGSRFEVDGLPAGTYGITLRAPGNLRLVVDRTRIGDYELVNSVAMPEVVLTPGETASIALEVGAGARLVGRVSAAGRPVSGARVRAVIAPHTSNFPAGFVLHGVHVWRLDSAYENGPHNPLSHVTGTTDAQGRYELTGLQPGAYRVEVSADGLSFERRMDVELGAGTVLELEHDLTEAGVLQLAVLGSSYIGLAPRGSSAPEILAILRDDSATFPGLRPGTWTVARYHSDASVAPVFLGEARIEAGRTTWLDLRESSIRARIGGTLLAGGLPVANAGVRIAASTTRTDASGAFRIPLASPPGFGTGFGASIEVRHAGIDYTFVPDVPGPVESLEVALDLGPHAVSVDLLDAAGARLAGRIEFGFEAREPRGTEPRSARGNVLASAEEPALLGPLPAGRLNGHATLADGLVLPFEVQLPEDRSVTLQRAATGTLELEVLRKGAPVGGARVTAWVWRGAGEPPLDSVEFVAESDTSHGQTNSEGRLKLMLSAGEILVSAHHGFMAPATSARLRLDPDARESLVFELE